MPAVDAGPVTEWLERWNAGQPAALDHILPLLYDDLRRVARRQLRSEPAGSLSATTVVHEAYLRLVQQRRIQAEDREAFLGVVACTMRRVLVDHARWRTRTKRGSGAPVESLDEEMALLTDTEAVEVLALDDTLARLAALNARAAAVVEYRIFGGLTIEETARVLGTSGKTVQRDWTTARAWLRKELGRDIASA